MIKRNRICISIIVIISIFSILIISENNKFFINIIDEKFQIQNSYEYTDNISVNGISYSLAKKQNINGMPKNMILAQNNKNNKLLWEYCNETYNGQLKKITYLNGMIYAVGSEYNKNYGTEKLMIISLNASTGSLNWKYYNDSFKYSRLNTMAIFHDTIYCAGYESNNALILSLNLNGTLKRKYILNDSNISEIKNIKFKNDSLFCEAKTWNNKNVSLVLQINQIDS